MKNWNRNFSFIKTAFSFVWKMDRFYAFVLMVQNSISCIYPLYNAFIISAIISKMSEKSSSLDLSILVILLLVGLCISRLISVFLNWIASSKFMKIQDKFVIKNSNKAMNMEYAATEDQAVLNLYSQAWRANIAAGNILEKLGLLVGYMIQLAGCIGIIMLIHPFFLLFLLGISGLNYYLDYKISKLEQDYSLKLTPLERNIEYIFDVVMNSVSGKDIRLYFADLFFPNMLKKLHMEEENLEYMKETKSCIYYIAQLFLQQAQVFILYAYLAIQFLQQHIKIGEFSFIVSSITILSRTFEGISLCWNQIAQHGTYLDLLDRFLTLPEKRDKPIKAIHKIEKIEFKNVWFRYPNSENYALKNINLTISPHEILSVVGENGSGKTTFIKLLLGLYSPTKGEIFINDCNVLDLSHEQYFSYFAPVFQDFQLFCYTIKENLLFEKNTVSDKTLEQLLQTFEMQDKIAELPYGWNTFLGKSYEKTGVDLSGGQKQRLAIIRALLKDSFCLVMDEPTAALDPIAELNLFEKLKTFAQTNLVIFVSHRISSSKCSDRVLFFQNGQIIEDGSYAQLLEQHGKFFEFYQLQAKYFQ